MTIEKLETYRGMLLDSKAIKQQIEDLQSLVVKAYKPTSEHSNAPSNPTEYIAMKVVALQEALEETYISMIHDLTYINDWLDTVTDGEIRAMIRWHYLNGYDWNQTNFKVLGYYSYDGARKRVERFFENERI